MIYPEFDYWQWEKYSYRDLTYIAHILTKLCDNFRSQVATLSTEKALTIFDNCKTVIMPTRDGKYINNTLDGIAYKDGNYTLVEPDISFVDFGRISNILSHELAHTIIYRLDGLRASVRLVHYYYNMQNPPNLFIKDKFGRFTINVCNINWLLENKDRIYKEIDSGVAPNFPHKVR